MFRRRCCVHIVGGAFGDELEDLVIGQMVLATVDLQSEKTRFINTRPKVEEATGAHLEETTDMYKNLSVRRGLHVHRGDLVHDLLEAQALHRCVRMTVSLCNATTTRLTVSFSMIACVPWNGWPSKVSMEKSRW